MPFIAAPVADLLALVAVQSGTEAVESGKGARESHCSALPRVVIQTALAKAPVRGARKDKIELLCLLGRTAAYLRSLFSLSILVSEIIKFHLQSREF